MEDLNSIIKNKDDLLNTKMDLQDFFVELKAIDKQCIYLKLLGEKW